jgi:hypothetical protein
VHDASWAIDIFDNFAWELHRVSRDSVTKKSNSLLDNKAWFHHYRPSWLDAPHTVLPA